MKKYFSKIILLVLLLLISTVSYGKTIVSNYFVGINNSAILENVKNQLASKQQEIISEPATTEMVTAFYEVAPAEIKKALQPFGYFRAKVTTDLSRKGGVWQAIFKIDLGRPLTITFLDVSIYGDGANNLIFKDFLKRIPLKIGSILNTEQYKAIKQQFFDLAFNNGYLYANIDKNAIRIDLQKYTAVVILHFNTGVRYKFGKTHFATDIFDESFLRRFLTFKEGDFYTTQQILNSQENLTNSAFFNEVNINPEPRLAYNYAVPLEVKLTPRKSKQYDFGLGYGTDTGVRALLGLEMRYLTKSGQHMKSFIKASRVQQDVEAHYLIPGKNPTTDQYDFSGAYERINQNYGDSSAFKVGAGYTTNIFKNWQETIRLGLQQERYNVQNKPKRNSLYLIPSYNVMHVITDDPIQPKRGSRINFNVQGAMEQLIGNSSFLQAQLDTKYMFPLTSVNIVILRGTIGYTAIKDLNSLPLSLQYFAGGTQTVRGYGYNSLGPGKDLLIGSAELRQKVIQNWYLAAFFDAGNTNDSFSMKLKRGVGVGIAWLSPVGTMELTYTKALDNPGRPGMVQFNMGPEF